MTNTFDAAMQAATDAVRAGDPMGATRLIQEALNGAARPQAETTARAAEAPPAVPGAKGRPFARRARPFTAADFADVADAPMPKPRVRMAPVHARARAVPDLPSGGRWLMRRHDGPAGGRDYRLFLPASAPTGLLVMLHGCTQDPEDFARGTRICHAAAPAGLAVAFPEQPRAANANLCWNWFETAHQGAARGEPAMLGELIGALQDELSVAPARSYVAGLSAGGAMAAVMAETHPDRIGAVGVHSGLPTGAARDLPSALAAMAGRGAGRSALRGEGPRVIGFHGDADRTVAPANLDRLLPPGGGAVRAGTTGGRAWRVERHDARAEAWRIEGLAHAWSGGARDGSHADPAGPDASAEMVRFFTEG